MIVVTSRQWTLSVVATYRNYDCEFHALRDLRLKFSEGSGVISLSLFRQMAALVAPTHWQVRQGGSATDLPTPLPLDLPAYDRYCIASASECGKGQVIISPVDKHPMVLSHAVFIGKSTAARPLPHWSVSLGLTL